MNDLTLSENIIFQCNSNQSKPHFVICFRKMPTAVFVHFKRALDEVVATVGLVGERYLVMSATDLELSGRPWNRHACARCDRHADGV